MNDPIAKAAGVPPPPQKPEPEECCGAGCIPCVLETYEQEMEHWALQHGEAYAKARMALKAQQNS